MKTLALLLLFSLFISDPTSARAEDASKIPMPPFPLTGAEEADARVFAERILREQFLPRAARSPESYQVQGIDLSEARLGDPFLDITLRGRSVDDYCSSTEDDPRLFPSVLRYCFPVFVANLPDPVIWIVLLRNRDEGRRPFATAEELKGHEQPRPEEEFMFWGYYSRESRGAEAVRLRDQYGSRISFVEFLDTGVPLHIILDAPHGILSGARGDTLKSIHENAPTIKRALR